MDSSAVRKAVLLVALAWTLVTISRAADGGFQKAQLLSITSGKGLDSNPTHRWATFTVQIGDIIYTGSGKRIKHQTDDYREGLNAGDTVEAAINGSEMLLRKQSGGEIKTKVIKRERAQ
jgi:hypothetical protein